MRERIFEPFFRLPGHAEREGGVGLGLSLVKQIAERHGGSVRCEPRDGGGSCFVITLPALIAGSARRGAARVAAAAAPGSTRQADARPAQPRRSVAATQKPVRAVQRGRRDAADVEGEHVAAAQADAPDRDRVDDQRHGGDALGAQHERGDRLRRVADVEQRHPGQQRQRRGDDRPASSV